ncbi:DUF4169 family protein [Hyphococcus sp.]|uniref:DUF4169 family protein n=1 Tax=Hyphococcus sp. TaxID=2038636 RepID=UPI002088F2C4|nr:MAG: hypothetical protein DHS20C04_13660 [Marinicaulis sp.]
MSDIVNLNRARKKKARREKEKRAEENRAKFGRTKADKKKRTAEQSKLDRHLDGHEIEE